VNLQSHPNFPRRQGNATKVESTSSSYAFPVPIDSPRDVLTEVLREGVRKMLAEEINDEVRRFTCQRTDLVDEKGHQQVVRNGYMPERTILTGVGPIPVKQPRVRDRRSPKDREKFTSGTLPPYLRKSKSLEELVPWLYLKGISAGDFEETLQASSRQPSLRTRTRRAPKTVRPSEPTHVREAFGVRRKPSVELLERTRVVHAPDGSRAFHLPSLGPGRAKGIAH
jgi:hypothetical protein